MRARVAKLLIFCAVMFAVAGGLASESRAASFTLESGKKIEGEVVYATRSAIMIKASNGSVQQLSLSDIKQVRIRLQSGEVVAGSLQGWSNRTYAVAAGDRLLKIQAARVIAEEAYTAEPKVAAPAKPRPAKPSQPQKTAKAQPKAAATVEIPPPSQSAPKQANAALAELKAEGQAARAALDDSQKLNEKLVAALEARAMEVLKLREELSTAKEKIAAQEAALSGTADKLEDVSGKLSAMYSNQEKLEAALEQSQAARLESERAVSQAEADMLGLKDNTEAYESRAAAFRLKLGEAAAALETVRQMLKQSENEKQSLRAALDETRREVERLNASMTAVEADRKKTEELAQELSRAKQAIEEMRSLTGAQAAEN